MFDQVMADTQQLHAPAGRFAIYAWSFVGALQGPTGCHPIALSLVSKPADMVNGDRQVREGSHHGEHIGLKIALSVQVTSRGNAALIVCHVVLIDFV